MDFKCIKTYYHADVELMFIKGKRYRAVQDEVFDEHLSFNNTESNRSYMLQTNKPYNRYYLYDIMLPLFKYGK